jgi:diaminopimelate epimerase
VTFHFSKYQATGNDFILADNRDNRYRFTQAQIQQLCHRHFGIGADGLLLIEPHDRADFKLMYFNSDGSQSLCGNGSRAAVIFAARLGLAPAGQTTFEAYDGMHQAAILPDGRVRLQMNDVNEIRELPIGQFINTGSPHVVQWVNNVEAFSVAQHGDAIRHDPAFAPGGTNVNFVEPGPDGALLVRTFERGVEAETYSCGTGVTAAALAAATRGFRSPVRVQTRGGGLEVAFEAGPGNMFTQIFLTGPAKLVFEGALEL